MRLVRACRRLSGRLTLTQRVALMSLVPMVVLGFVLTRVIERQVRVSQRRRRELSRRA